MDVKEAVSLFRFYQQSNHRRRTRDSYLFLLQHFDALYADRPIDAIRPDEVYDFLERMTRDLAKSTRRLRYAQLKAFFNFVIEKCCPDLKNPCSAPLLSKTFRMPKQIPKVILDKEVVDEMIYNTGLTPKNRSSFYVRIWTKKGGYWVWAGTSINRNRSLQN
jgi:integrase